MTIHELLAMPLGYVTKAEDRIGWNVLRVPGGWIYYVYTSNGGYTSTFVPEPPEVIQKVEAERESILGPLL